MPPNALTPNVVTPNTQSEETSQQLSILLQKITGAENTQVFTEEQTNEILSQRRKITEYVHEDRKRDSYDGKFYLVVVVLFVFAFSALVLHLYPEVFSQVLGLVIGLFGGGAGGYAIGKSKN